MFSICPRSVYQNKGLSATDIRVYITIQGFANAQGYCYPCINKIADICGVCRRTVERSLSNLEKANVLARRKHLATNGGYTSNDYYLNLNPEDVTNQQIDDATNLSQGMRQRSRKVCDKFDASNNIAFKQDSYVNNKNARAHTHAREGGENAAELGNEIKAVLELGDLNDVLECCENVKGAADNYRFFKEVDGRIVARAFWALADKTGEIGENIERFFEFTIKRDVEVQDFENKSLYLGEIPIIFERG